MRIHLSSSSSSSSGLGCDCESKEDGSVKSCSRFSWPWNFSNLAWTLVLLDSEIPLSPRAFTGYTDKDGGEMEDDLGIDAEHHEMVEYEQAAMEGTEYTSSYGAPQK